MIKKSFYIDFDGYDTYCVCHNGQPLIGTFSEEDADLTCNILNELFEENIQLKVQLRKFYSKEEWDLKRAIGEY